MQEENIKLQDRETSPLLAIGIAVLVATIMTIVTTLIFLNSGAYTTVKQIQTGSEIITPYQLSQVGIDTSKPIKASDIDDYASTIQKSLQTLNDNQDFGPVPVSDNSLGL